MTTHSSLFPSSQWGFPSSQWGWVLNIPSNAPLWLPAPQRVVDRVLLALHSDTIDETPASQPGPHSGPRPLRPVGDGNKKAQPSMEQLVRDHADAVYRVALSVTKDPVLAEDVSQDTLIKAWQALPNFRGDAPVRHWILRIAHNTSISALRKRREDVVAPFDLPEQVATDAAVDVQVQDRLAIDRFEAALAGLDSTSRSIVVLREIEGMSYAEIGDVLQLPLPTIRTRLLRARRQLAEALDGWQP